ncbi:hypothetical protein [Christiangramia sp. SM2212]|uniref:Uncharacterized protein n=1 Tax=Christiangramia sediminicola TaxID=3073267 RepID=A0ABU1EPF4_9FLAO|nr:hypothetical protein [Christiangramia sp. SM2212]MDR5590269.1 hypothetical protein [Christiangramia sp. SM2212]
MNKENNNEQADWQKNSGRPSNFHEKDEKLKKDGDGNLKVNKNSDGLSDEENKTIQGTLDSISEEDDD